MAYDEDNTNWIEADTVVGERLTVEEALAALPAGAPSGIGGKGQPFTEEDKKWLSVLKSLAVSLAAKHGNYYTHSLLLDVLGESQRGSGTQKLFRYIAGHWRRPVEGKRWSRVLPQHRGKEGKKFEVYVLVEDTDTQRPEVPSCGCVGCSQSLW